jgi:hypothetical protein
LQLESRADRHGPTARVDIASVKCGEFAVAQAGEGGHQDRGPESAGHSGGEVEDLGDGGDGTFGRTLDAGALDAARFAMSRTWSHSRFDVPGVKPEVEADRSGLQLRTFCDPGETILRMPLCVLCGRAVYESYR